MNIDEHAPQHVAPMGAYANLESRGLNMEHGFWGNKTFLYKNASKFKRLQNNIILTNHPRLCPSILSWKGPSQGAWVTLSIFICRGLCLPQISLFIVANQRVSTCNPKPQNVRQTEDRNRCLVPIGNQVLSTKHLELIEKMSHLGCPENTSISDMR